MKALFVADQQRHPPSQSDNAGWTPSQLHPWERALEWEAARSVGLSPLLWGSTRSRISLLARSTLIASATLFLLLRCTGHFNGGYRIGGFSRLLAEGPPQWVDVCRGDVAHLEGSEGQHDEPADSAQGEESSAERHIIREAEECARRDGWGIRRVPPGDEKKLRSNLKELGEIARKSMGLLRTLEPIAATEAVKRVTSRAAVELTALSIGPERLENLRQWTTQQYIDLASKTLELFGGSCGGRLRSRLSRLLILIKEIRKPNDFSKTIAVLAYRPKIRTSIVLCQHANTLTNDSLSAILTSSSEASSRGSASLVRQELRALQAIFRTRLLQSLRDNILRSLLLKAERRLRRRVLVGGRDILVTENAGLFPSARELQAEVEAAVDRAREGRFSMLYPSEDSDPEDGCQLERTKEATSQFTGKSVLVEGDVRAPKPYSSHGSQLVAKQTAKDRNLIRKGLQHLSIADEDTQAKVRLCLQKWKELVMSVDASRLLLTAAPRLKLLKLVATLATIELSGFSAGPRETELLRQNVARCFATLLRMSLEEDKDEHSQGKTIQELQGLQKVLTHLQCAAPELRIRSEGGHEKILRRHLEAALKSVAHVSLAIKQLNPWGAEGPGYFSIDEVDHKLAIIQAIVETRKVQILKNTTAAYWLFVAQLDTKCWVVFTRESWEAACACSASKNLARTKWFSPGEIDAAVERVESIRHQESRSGESHSRQRLAYFEGTMQKPGSFERGALASSQSLDLSRGLPTSYPFQTERQSTLSFASSYTVQQQASSLLTLPEQSISGARHRRKPHEWSLVQDTVADASRGFPGEAATPWGIPARQTHAYFDGTMQKPGSFEPGALVSSQSLDLSRGLTTSYPFQTERQSTFSVASSYTVQQQASSSLKLPEQSVAGARHRRKPHEWSLVQDTVADASSGIPVKAPPVPRISGTAFSKTRSVSSRHSVNHSGSTGMHLFQQYGSPDQQSFADSSLHGAGDTLSFPHHQKGSSVFLGHSAYSYDAPVGDLNQALVGAEHGFYLSSLESSETASEEEYAYYRDDPREESSTFRP